MTIDTLWGEPALAAMQVANRWARHVEVGSVAAEEIKLAAPALRSVSLDLLGFSIAHPPADLQREAFLTLTRHAAQGDIAVDLERSRSRRCDGVGAPARGAGGVEARAAAGRRLTRAGRSWKGGGTVQRRSHTHEQ